MTPYRDEDEDGWDDGETDIDADRDSDDAPTVPCPSCRHEILEDSPRCPHCGRYLSAEDHEATGKPLWVIVTALVCLAVALWWVVAS